eukprot:scaffold34_cov260-Pinguiococcus_pyrenoidosus.AAC.15
MLTELRCLSHRRVSDQSFLVPLRNRDEPGVPVHCGRRQEHPGRDRSCRSGRDEEVSGQHTDAGDHDF